MTDPRTIHDVMEDLPTGIPVYEGKRVQKLVRDLLIAVDTYLALEAERAEELCPHVVHSDEGTAFCTLAEGNIPIPNDVEGHLYWLDELAEMNAPTLHVTLIERNDHEGETWRFYIPLGGNEEALSRLNAALAFLGPDEFELDMTPVPESEIATRQRVAALNDDGCYMDPHNKLSGKLVLPAPEDIAGDVEEWWHDALYKGGIHDFMREND